jgi:hypothetical protein
MHLANTIRDALYNAENLEYMEVESGDSYVADLFNLTLSIVNHRAWSLAVRCGVPPECKD